MTGRMSSTLFPYTTLFRSKGAAPRIMATAANEGTQGITAIATTANIAMITAMTTLAITGMDAHASIHRSEEHTSELQSQSNLVCRLLLEKKNTTAAERRTS